MAQHIEVRNKVMPKILQNIGASIEREVQKGLSKTSMRWEYRGFTNANDLNEVWFTNRYIGKGIVYGDKRGLFEVHVNGNIAEHIYLVA